MDASVGQFRGAFDRAFDAMVVLDEAGQIIEANRSAHDLFGVEESDCPGRPLAAFLAEDGGVDLSSSDRSGDEDPGGRVEVVREDGERRTVRYAVTTDVTPGSHLLVFRDDSDRSDPLRTREEPQSKYHHLVEQNIVGIYIIQDREFVYVNPRQAEIFGETPEAMIGRSPLEWVDEAEHERVKENLRKREDGEEERIEYTISGYRSDGEHIYFEVHGGRIELDGRPAVIGAIQDVTERVEQKQALERQNERLSEFASIVSHDLRNPLNVAMGGLELAQAECESEHLEMVSDALDRSEELIEDLLALARAGDGLGDLETVDLPELVDRCWRTIDTNDATIVRECTGTVRADRGRLRQLLENLIRNAVEHGSTSNQTPSDDAVEHGSGRPHSSREDAVEQASTGDLDVSDGVRSNDGLTIRIGDLPDGFYVADDGHGIAEVDRERVFESGYSTEQSGTGFGLDIVKQVADAHGWEVSITTSEDGGASFEIRGVRTVPASGSSTDS